MLLGSREGLAHDATNQVESRALFQGQIPVRKRALFQIQLLL